MNKEEYRYILKRYQKYIKIAVVVEHLGIDKTNIKHFLSGNDLRMSIEKLEEIKCFIETLPERIGDEE